MSNDLRVALLKACAYLESANAIIRDSGEVMDEDSECDEVDERIVEWRALALDAKAPAKLDVGVTVTWRSQSAGIWKTKTGKITLVVPPGDKPCIKNCGSARDHESYVVRCDGRAYWPIVSKLEVSP